jgi:cobalt/nickel transport system permease protein
MRIADWIEIGRMDELGRMDTPAHRLDARSKAVVTLVFIGLVMSFSRYEISALVPFLLYPVALAGIGRIPARHILKKMLVAAPFAVLIGLANPLLDRQPIATLGSLTLTGGWVSFASILLRFVLTVGAALVLVACTGMHRLGAGLEQLGVPRVFVMQLLFLYRYLFVVSDEAARIMRGVELRANGVVSLRLRVYGSLVGQLLLRSMDRADRVYRAMVARGFDGEVHLMTRTSLRWQDAVFVVGSLTYLVAARVWNLSEVLGNGLSGAIS